MRLYETNLWKFLESHSQNSLDLAERLELSRKIIVEVEWYTYNMLIHRDLKERLRNSFFNSLSVLYNTLNYRFNQFGHNLCHISDVDTVWTWGTNVPPRREVNVLVNFFLQAIGNSLIITLKRTLNRSSDCRNSRKLDKIVKFFEFEKKRKSCAGFERITFRL